MHSTANITDASSGAAVPQSTWPRLLAGGAVSEVRFWLAHAAFWAAVFGVLMTVIHVFKPAIVDPVGFVLERVVLCFVATAAMGVQLTCQVALAIDAVTSFSVVPLRFASHLGMLFGLAGLVSLGLIVAVWLQGGTVQGWASLAALILIMGSVQLLVLGVFGEYLGRMYMEGKHRPLFIIAEVRRHPVASAAAAEPSEVIRVAS